jgi:hypothetical protein
MKTSDRHEGRMTRADQPESLVVDAQVVRARSKALMALDRQPTHDDDVQQDRKTQE